MLQKENRLAKDRDFQTVYQKGRFLRGDSLSIKFTANQLTHSRFGIIVSNKISKKPTVRNKIKRRLREIIRLLLKDQKIKSGFDVVVFTQPKIVQAQYQDLQKKLFTLLKRTNLID